MTSKLKDIKRTLLVDELQKLLDELKAYRSRQVEENQDSSALVQRMEFARQKLDHLKAIQRKDKAVQAHRRQIAQDNAKRD